MPKETRPGRDARGNCHECLADSYEPHLPDCPNVSKEGKPMNRTRTTIAGLILALLTGLFWPFPAHADTTTTDQASKISCIGGWLKNRSQYNLWYGSRRPTPQYPQMSRVAPYDNDHIAYCRTGPNGSSGTLGTWVWFRGDCQTMIATYGSGNRTIVDRIGKAGYYGWVNYKFPGTTIRFWCPRG